MVAMGWNKSSRKFSFASVTATLSIPAVCAESLQSSQTLCDPTDCSPPGSSGHWISQARILEWVAIPSSRESSPPRGGNWGRWILYHWATRETFMLYYIYTKLNRLRKQFSVDFKPLFFFSLPWGSHALSLILPMISSLGFRRTLLLTCVFGLFWPE